MCGKLLNKPAQRSVRSGALTAKPVKEREINVDSLVRQA